MLTSEQILSIKLDVELPWLRRTSIQDLFHAKDAYTIVQYHIYCTVKDLGTLRQTQQVGDVLGYIVVLTVTNVFCEQNGGEILHLFRGLEHITCELPPIAKRLCAAFANEEMDKSSRHIFLRGSKGRR